MATNTDWLELNEQGSAPATPDTSKWRVYAKSDGLYIVDDAGTETGPFGSGGGSLTDHTHAATGSGSDGGGATLAPTSLTGAGLVVFSGQLQSTIDADQNDWNPTDLHTYTGIVFTNFSANRTLTGLNAGSTGEIKVLINNTSYSLILSNESGSSSASNRFRCPNAASVTVRKGGSVMLGYYWGRWCAIAI